MKTFISIATYNEKENIAKLLEQIFVLPLAGLFVIVTDDNSPDGTAEVVEELKDRFVNLQLIKRPAKLGYGSAHAEAFVIALSQGADIVVSIDADFSHDPKYLPLLIQKIQAGYQLAIGSRKISGGQIVGWNWYRRLASGTAMLIARAILGLKTKDVTSGFRAYTAVALRLLKLDSLRSDGYSFLEEILYQAEQLNLQIVEVPIIFNDRQEGRSKFSAKEIYNFFVTIFRLKFKKSSRLRK